MLLYEPKDYDGAARIKDVLVRMRALYESFQSIQLEMHQAAKEEDYILASQLKNQRDQARESVLDAMEEVGDIVRDYSFSTQSHSLEDLSLSTISGEDPSSSSMIREKINYASNEKEVRWNHATTYSCENSSSQTNINERGDEVSTATVETESPDNVSRIVAGFREHPLYGVPGYDDLPIPEDISYEDGHVSPEAVQKVESLMGSYVSRCFYSKNWSLREAAIQKTSITVPSLRDQVNKDIMSRGLLLMAERGLDDRIVQVVLTALVFLDCLITEFEKGGITPRDAIPLLTPIILNLMGKLGDSKPKVVDTAEKALMSFALSTSVGPSCIGHHLIKRTNIKDIKGGKALVTRFILLRQLMEDFDLHEGPSSERLLEFVRDCGMNHKEAEVRDAAKDLAVAIYVRDGTTIDVLSMLEGLSDRQVKEYKIAFAAAKKSRGGRGALMRDPQKIEQRVNLEEMSRPESPEATGRPFAPKYQIDDSVMLETSGVRGRGRGRGRNTSLQPQYPLEHSNATMAGTRLGRHVPWPVSKMPNTYMDEQESDFD